MILRHHERRFLEATDTDDSQKDLFGLLLLAENTQNKLRRQQDHDEWRHIKNDVLYYFGLSETDHAEMDADILEDFRDSY